MLRIKKRIVVQRETFERVRISRRPAAKHFCSECSAETVFLTLDEIVSRSNIKTREMLPRLEANEFHTTEAASGHLLICLQSLEREFRNELQNVERG